MRQKFAFYPDQTRARLEPYAGAKKAALIFAAAVTGIVGLHSLYLQADATIEPGHRGDLLNQPRDAFAQKPSQRAPEQVPPSVNASLLLTSEAEPATARSAIDSGPAAAGQSQVSEGPAARGLGESSSDLPNKIGNPPPPPKKKSVQSRRGGAGGVYAQYPYSGYGGQWAWYSHRPSPSPFFHY
jgi:hypothetical protein